MKIVFRVDSSLHIGSGHLYRTLTLAKQLAAQNSEVLIYFICRDLYGNSAFLIQQNGFPLLTIPVQEEVCSQIERVWTDEEILYDVEQTRELLLSIGEIDLLIIDHYGLDKRWENEMKTLSRKIMVIDDLANREHACDILLDQNYYTDQQERYNKFVPPTCLKMQGPAYSLLRSEFASIRRNLKKQYGTVKRMFVFFGGSDETNETAKALHAIRLMDELNIQFDVVVGFHNPYKAEIEEMCRQLQNTRFYCQIDYIAELMACADLGLGAGGATTWERSALGLPSVVISTAENQERLSIDCDALGISKYLGRSHEVDAEQILHTIQELINNPERIQSMSEKGMELVDGSGTSRVVKGIFASM